MYFTHGRLLAQSGNIKVYLFNNLLHLEENHVLWAIEDEIKEYKEQIANYPHGACLELGLGLGVASRYILSCEGVDSLTTIELQEDVIKVQKQVNFINDSRHTIICMDGFEYLISTDKKYDFIFMDHYHFADEDGLPLIKKYVEMCKKRVLKEGGKIVGWFDIYTPEEFVKPFYNLFK
jgi:spermidine synthase